jgi:hypothetical protein
MLKPYKKIHERIQDFKKYIENWIKEEETRAKNENREPRNPAISTFDLQKELDYNDDNKGDWIPRHIRNKMIKQGIHLKKGRGYTLVKIILSDKPVNTFGKENAVGQREDL